MHPSLLANDGNQQCCRQLHAVTGRTLVHPDLAIGFVGSSFQLATAVGPAMRTQIEVCFVVLVSFRGWLTYALLLRSPALSLLITRVTQIVAQQLWQGHAER